MTSSIRNLAISSLLLALVGCAVAPADDGASPAKPERGRDQNASQQASQPLTTGASTGESGGAASYDFNLKLKDPSVDPGGPIDPGYNPDVVGKSCMDKCKETHISNGWCGAYCVCREFGGSVSVCEREASDRFIDI